MNHHLKKTIFFFISAAIALPSIATAQLANQEQIHVQTSTPKKNGETAFSYLVSWRKGSGRTIRANGLMFIDGPDKRKPTTAVSAAHKMAIAFRDAVSYEAPTDRGIEVKHNKGESEILVANKEGFDLINATFRDYSNQTLSYDLSGNKFNESNVELAIDFVYAVDVEYIDGFPPPADLNKVKGGTVSVQIDDEPPIEISTEGKSTMQIENELATALKSRGSFSIIPIYPNFTTKKSRNYKPFDGGEVQLIDLSAHSITIDVNDSSLGVLTKFSFPDMNKPADVAGKIPYIFGVIITGLILMFLYMAYGKKGNEEDE